ncbi:MAG: hypothetical protein NTY01_21000 [Verrucomicrobia bacterium]|nr:hypothetical protein [Verrucomicrobiota bacterium]
MQFRLESKIISVAASLLLSWDIPQRAEADEAQPTSYTLLAPPERASVPTWAQPGRMRYGRCDGGPIEVCKAFMSGWEQIRHPDAILPCATEYNDATIAMLKRARINWVWVTWSVGFSYQSEAVQRRLVAPFIAKCRAAGIRISAYVSLTNMFIDDMVKNVPCSANWMQVEADGTPRPYSGAKYDGKPTRIIACLNNPEWLEYSKQQIASAVAAGVDAIFYDNSFHSCKCRLCQQKFAGFTKSLYGQPLPVPGIKTAAVSGDMQGREGVAPANAPGLAAKAWAMFCNKTVSAALAQHRQYADSLKPGILVYANTHQQPFQNDGLNAIFTEDGHEPGLRGAELSSNIGLYKFFYAEGDGCKPIRIECGRRIHADRMDNLMPPRSEMLAVYESAASQGAQQTFMEMGFTTKLACGDQAARDSLAALGVANRWLAEHEALFAQVEPIAKTAVVLPAYEPLTPLMRAGRNFVVLQPKHLTSKQLAQFALVALLNVRCMTDEQAEAVLGYMKQGGRLIATGETSSCDGVFRTRAKPALASLQGADRCVWLPGKPTTEELLAEWRRLDNKPLVELVSAPEHLSFNVARSWDGKRTLVYLINYGPQAVAGCEVKLSLPKMPRSLRLHVPGGKPRQLTGNVEAAGLAVKIPAFDLFAVLEAM